MEINEQELFSLNWATLNPSEQRAWLEIFVAKKKIAKNESGQYICDNIPLPSTISLDFLHSLERNLVGKMRDLYIENVTNETSTNTYRGMTDEQIKSPETTTAYYFNLLTTPVELRAKCLYYAAKGEYV